MNRSQFVFVMVVNALLTLVLTSTALLVYDWRRPAPEFSLPPLPSPVTSQNESPVEAAAAADAPASPTSAAVDVNAAAGGGRTYTVREGDSLSAIAQLFGVSQNSLAQSNGIVDPNLIIPGQTLVIPPTDVVEGEEAYQPQASDLLLQVMHAGSYAEEEIVVGNQGARAFTLSSWSIWTSLEEQYRFGAMTPLFPGESVRLRSREGEDSIYVKHWGRSPRSWETGTVIVLINPAGDEIQRLSTP